MLICCSTEENVLADNSRRPETVGLFFIPVFIRKISGRANILSDRVTGVKSQHEKKIEG